MISISDFMSVLAPFLTGAALFCAFAILAVRCLAEPFAPGIKFGPLVRRLVDRRELEPGGPAVDDASAASRQVRRRLRHNEWALHTQIRLILWILCVMLLSRLLILASAMVGSVLTGSLNRLFTAAISHWVRSDAASYIDIARNGYDMAANPENLVFLPLYPLTVRLMSVLCLGHYVFAGFFVSNVCLMGAGWALYHLVNGIYGERTARRSVLFLMFAPLSLVFSVPYAESMFLMFTLLAVLSARYRQFIPAAVFGALSCATRLIGVLVIIPVFMEALKYLHSLDLRRRNRGRFFRYLALYALLSLSVLLGTAAYLVVNKIAAGSFFAFAGILRDNWYQSIGSILNTESYSVRNAFEWGDAAWQLGTWIPQSLYIFAAAVLILCMSTTVQPAEGMYCWLYLMITMAPGWLLSGPRTITSIYPVYIMLAMISRKKWNYLAIIALFIAALCFFSYTYALMGSVV